MAQSKWEADKMLDVYIYDYLTKRNLQATAKAFLAEGNVATDPVAIDAPGGFLFEWWSVFWDIFIARTNPKHSDVAAAFIETQQMKAREQQQQQQMQQLQLMQRQHVMQQPLRDAGHPGATTFNGGMNTMNPDPVLGPSATVLAAKLIEERMKNPSSMGSEASPQLLESRMALLKSGVGNRSGPLVPGNSVNVSTIQQMQQMQARNQQTDMKGDLSVLQRTLPVDPALYGQNIMQAKPGLSGVGLNQGVSGLPLKGWPLTGIDQLRPNLGMQKQFVTSQNQVQIMSPRQQFLAQAQAQGLTNSAEMGQQGFRSLPGGGFSGKDAQPNGNDGSIGSPVQSSSSKMNVAQMQQSSTQQPQEMQQHQQMQQNSRKRKPTSSGPANSTGTGNHPGPSPPSTPSTHTPGDAGVTMATAGGTGNLQPQMGVMQKNPMMYSSETMGGFASSSNQMDILDHCGDMGFFDDNVESFLSNDDTDPREIFAALKRSPADNSDSLKGFAFTGTEVNRSSTNKVTCCHFSSDGKILASAGHDKRVNLWNMETQHIEHRAEEHGNFITDIRFRVGTTQLATSSYDGTVRLWDAAERGGSIQSFMGHSSPVTSLDFHPKRTELFCSCDDNGEIRFWLVGQSAPSRVSRGGNGKVRFQPRVGRFLAATFDSTVNIFDIEATDHMQPRTLKGHNSEVLSVCWDENGDFLASVSQDTVKVWSIATMECVHEMSSNGNKFYSCVFHPRYAKILIVGGYQSMELWSVTDNQRMTVQGHEGQIVALAQSPLTGLVASASHDRTVKIWK